MQAHHSRCVYNGTPPETENTIFKYCFELKKQMGNKSWQLLWGKLCAFPLMPLGKPQFLAILKDMTSSEHQKCEGLPGGSEGKVSACNVGDLGSIPGLGRSQTEM